MNRHYIRPQYMKKFQCIGGGCEDTCCQGGWNIPIDKQTLNKYKRVKRHPLGVKIAQYMRKNKQKSSEEDTGQIKLKENGSCPFLMNTGFCEVQSQLGESYLSNTCRQYPRHYSIIDGVWESSLSCSCPEVTRIALLNPNKMAFDQEVIESNERVSATIIHTTGVDSPKWHSYFWDIRIFSIGLMQNRDYNLQERLLILGFFIKELNKYITSKQVAQIPNLINAFQQKINKMLYKGILEEVEDTNQLMINLLSRLIGNPNKRLVFYKDKFDEVIQGLEIDEDYNVNNENYKKAIALYNRDTLVNYDYILENFLVNEMFRNVFPIQMTRPWEDYQKLVILYALVKLMSIGKIAYEGRKMTQDELLSEIQLISKCYTHQTTYWSEIIKSLKACELDTLGAMGILIKS